MTVVTHEELKKRTEAIILDMSRYNDPIDYQKMIAMVEPRIAGVQVQVSYGWYQDKDAGENISGAKAVNMPFGTYHYFYPDAGIDNQVKAFQYAINQHGTGVLFPWLDVEEKTFKCSAAQYCERIAQMCNHMDKITGMRTIIYSSPSMLDILAGYAPEAYAKYVKPRLKCIAKYLNSGYEAPSNEFPSKYANLKPRTEVIFHQTSCKGDGKEFGFASYEGDVSRFLLGDENELMQFMEYSRKPYPSEEIEEPTPEEPQPECDELWQKYQALQAESAAMEQVIEALDEAIESMREDTLLYPLSLWDLTQR